MTWPGFTVITNAWWFLLLIPLVVFYFLKLKRPRMEVPSLTLWQSVINDQRVNSPFQKFRRSLLLLLQLIVLCLLILGAMQPFIPTAADRSENLPILVDCSASMGARDAQTGQTRLALAKEQLQQLIDNLLPGQRLSLIAMHATAQRLTEFTDNRRILEAALERLVVHDVPGRIEDALQMTQALARSVPIETAVIYSDGNFPQQVNFDLPFEVNYQKIAPAGSNVGITEFNARQNVRPDWTVFLRVEASAASSGQVELWQDGTQVGVEDFILDSGESQRLIFDIESALTSQLEAKMVIASDCHDALAADNVAYLELPTPRNLQVYAHPELASFRHALRNFSGIDIHPAEGKPARSAAEYDLVISDQVSDEAIASTVYLFVGSIPRDVTDGFTVRPGLTDIIRWERSSPLLQHMQLRDVQINDDVQQADEFRDGDLEDLGYEVLAHGRNGAVILQQREGRKLRFFILFHPDRSTLPYRVAFPVLVKNTIDVAFYEAAIGEVRGLKTRILPPLTLTGNRTCEIQLPDGTSLTAKTDESGTLAGVPALQVGEYLVKDATGEPERLSLSLLSTDETSLATVQEIQFSELSVEASGSVIESDRPLWSPLAMIAFGVLLLEWWFYQRRTVI
ncbi:MAG: VWA domain-containing protein, partial [Planctomycetaceae bacterium]